MMYIEGHWETVNTIEDIVRVVREYYNGKLATKLEELKPDGRIIEEAKENLKELEWLREVVDDIRGLVN